MLYKFPFVYCHGQPTVKNFLFQAVKYLQFNNEHVVHWLYMWYTDCSCTLFYSEWWWSRIEQRPFPWHMYDESLCCRYAVCHMVTVNWALL